MSFLIRWIPTLLLAVLFAGCSSTPIVEQEAQVADHSVGAGQEGAATMGAGGMGAWTGNPLDDPNSPLSNKVIYFDFDRSEVKPEYLDTIRAHAEYLATHPDVMVTIEGHCDERGTREYNLALGERRANAVANLLTAEGVARSQITTISYGEERSIDAGHDEAAWALNRRAVLVY
ncbi:MAG TPA: peptidoglycan-associated lipoprotein Pal [Chromatiales bacterium]|nr:peptidoglycan-associated lipoprotein Pal [Chromatiales bacterium]